MNELEISIHCHTKKLLGVVSSFVLWRWGKSIRYKQGEFYTQNFYHKLLINNILQLYRNERRVLRFFYIIICWFYHPKNVIL